MTLSTDFDRLSLPLADDFGTTYGTRETAANVRVRIADESGTVGVGAASPAAYYDESVESALAVLPELLVVVEDVGDPHAQQRIERRLRERAPDQAAARAAVSIAVHDLAASQQSEPLYRRWGLDPDTAPTSSYSIGIDTPERMAEKAERAVDDGYSILKIKVGTDSAERRSADSRAAEPRDDDRARVAAIREAAPDARLRVDANGGWEPEEAIAATEWLADQGVEFVEQPVPADDIDGLRAVSEDGALPVAADESCVTADGVPRVADAVDIVVVKVSKCGGLRGALQQIATANAHGLETMVGCMVTSNAAIAGACHLAPLCEYVDLDGALLLAEDPYDGVPMPEGRLDLDAVDSGTGAVSR
ncbi:dipeptide epimerase [Salinibaculum rarum]|uniref:dipeptide epimerase n=1 Tax=Salinibaculum rarum TaxID=3058903 RepID=UPI00265D9E47|nr:dipeptide epimerase [Salinibaculum sp. KK48]